MRKVEKNILEIKEDVQIGDIILEAGDKIQMQESRSGYAMAYVDDDGDDRGEHEIFISYETYVFVEVDMRGNVMGFGDFDDEDEFDYLDPSPVSLNDIPREVQKEF